MTTMKRARALSAILAALLAITTSATAATILHQPNSLIKVGDPAHVSVQIVGVTGGNTTVDLHYRGVGATDYKAVSMTPGDAGVFRAVIPPIENGLLGLEYYVEISAGDSFAVNLGSSGQPMAVDIVEPTAGVTGSTSFPYAAFAGVILLIAGVFKFHEISKRKTLTERRFWVRTLYNITKLSKQQMAREVTRLCGTPLAHPTKGLTVFERKMLFRKLQEVREIDPRAFSKECDHYLGVGVHVPNPPVPETIDKPVGSVDPATQGPAAHRSASGVHHAVNTAVPLG